MKNLFSVPTYQLSDGKFQVVGIVTYEITYLHGKLGSLRVIVNGFETHQRIDMNNPNSGYKRILLTAISEYVSRDTSKHFNNVKKHIKLQTLQQMYNKRIVNNVVNYLLSINKEVDRDTLTEYNLINSPINTQTT